MRFAIMYGTSEITLGRDDNVKMDTWSDWKRTK